MAYTLGNKCAKNLCKRIVLLQLIIENVVTCFFWNTVYIDCYAFVQPYFVLSYSLSYNCMMMKINDHMIIVFKGSCECFVLSLAVRLRLFHVNCFICFY